MPPELSGLRPAAPFEWRAAAATDADVLRGPASDRSASSWRGSARGEPPWAPRRTDKDDVGNAIRACRTSRYDRSSAWWRVIEVLVGAREDAIQLSQLTFNSAIGACRGNWRPALQQLRLMRECSVATDSISGISAIGSCDREWRPALSLLWEVQGDRSGAVWERREKRHDADQAQLFGTAINACALGREWQRAVALLVEARRWHVQPNLAMYNAALRACSLAGDVWEHALALFGGMERDRCAPDEFTFRSAISSVEGCGAWEAALLLLAAHARAGLEPEAILEVSVAGACNDAAEWQQAFELASSLRHSGLFPRDPRGRLKVTNSAIFACKAAGEWRQALAMFSATPHRSVTTYNAAIGAAEAGGALVLPWRARRPWVRAVALLAQMDRLAFEPAEVTYGSAIDCCEKGAEWQRGLDLLWDAVERQVTPLDGICRIAARACAAGGAWQQALLLLQATLRPCDGGNSQIPPATANMICSVVGACGTESAWRRALQLLFELPVDPRVLDVTVFNAAISACETAGEWQQALALFALAGSRGRQAWSPDAVSCNALLSACEKGAQWKRALALLESMRRHGPDPTPTSLNAALSACEKASQWEAALALLAGRAGWHPLGAAQTRAPSARAATAVEGGRVDVEMIPYNAVIAACAKSQEWKRALALLDDALTTHIQPDRIAYSIAIGAVLEAKTVSPSQQPPSDEAGAQKARRGGPRDDVAARRARQRLAGLAGSPGPARAAARGAEAEEGVAAGARSCRRPGTCTTGSPWRATGRRRRRGQGSRRGPASAPAGPGLAGEAEPPRRARGARDGVPCGSQPRPHRASAPLPSPADRRPRGPGEGLQGWSPAEGFPPRSRPRPALCTQMVGRAGRARPRLRRPRGGRWA
ncbi:unnamed protein product [Prorocentrum cordatum]|uniref:Pentatricopeptide repeat-containing protein, chloroplastic n=1 Tax=Prorocentrum cordatum TaxID=2364126 RepID=A0ABN9XMJ1_9DINO|nr:unnamed protein product [Polarella glacialis]